MQYMLLIYADPSAAPRSEAEGHALYEAFQTFTKDLRSSGTFVVGDPLGPATSATTVRVRDGKLAITDGPFAETKEWLGGFLIIQASSLDEALEVAKKCPGAKYGSVEIRPIVHM
ncbi:MAG TPA: YciI family protein [Candidatus Tumulicola sp.]